MAIFSTFVLGRMSCARATSAPSNSPAWPAPIIEELEKLAKETEFAAGYQRVRTVNIARENLYLKSGHLPYYRESMFPPMTLRPEMHLPSLVDLEKNIEATDAQMEKDLEAV